MRRLDLPSGEGLRLEVPTTVRAGLRLEVAAGRRMVLRQHGRAVLLARVDTAHYGVYLHSSGGYESPLPPIRADEARSIPPGDGLRWTYRVAGWLDATDSGPLHGGPWLLRPHVLQPHTAAELVHDNPAYLDWFGTGWNGIVPLRALPGEDSGRVKAYRKLAAEQLLPPIVLWWVSGLDGWLLLDGHARLVAALAEGVMPPALALGNAERPADQQVWLAKLTADHETAIAHLQRQIAAGHPGAQDAERQLSAWYGATIANLTSHPGRTVAWPLPGGATAWTRIAADLAPGWAGGTERPEPPG
jgi:hypothetical protein